MLEQDISILQTKLYRPLPARDTIARSRLTGLLDEGLDHPLTLVSAPAGYGKSTLVSQWVETLDASWRAGWLSVDESDDDLGSFLRHLLAALQRAVPGCCEGTGELVNLESLPTADDLLRMLSNELAALDQGVVVVIDDFHRLHASAVSDFLSSLLEYPPPCLHMVIVTRRDPGFSLNRLRAKGGLGEIRLEQLRFRREEIESFLERSFWEQVPPDLVEMACTQVEGWPVALRLLILTLRDVEGGEELTRRLPSAPALVSSFLIEGILDRIDDDRRAAMLQISLVDRFNAELCAAVVPGLNARDFLDWLVAADLFVISLDKRGGWNRFHHLFQDALQVELRKRQSPDEVRATHQRVAMWFASHQLISEAIGHYLKAGDLDGLGEMLVGQIANRDAPPDRCRIRRWFQQIPLSAIDARPVLLGEYCIYLNEEARLPESYEATDRLEALLADGFDGPPELEAYLLGVAGWARTYQLCEQRKLREAVRVAEHVLDILPAKETALRGELCMPLSTATRALGDVDAARAWIERIGRELAEAQYYRPHTLHCEALLEFLLGDTRRLAGCSSHYIKHCEEHDFRDFSVNARFYATWAAYQRDDLEAAARFAAERDGDAQIANPQHYVITRKLEVEICLARAQLPEARERLTLMRDYVRRHPGPHPSHCFEATQALVALREGRISEAAAWVKGCKHETLDSHPLGDFAGVPLQVLLLQNTEESRGLAAVLLDRLVKKAEKANQVSAHFELRALRSLWHHAESREKEALADLREAVRLAQPGGAVRIFADIAANLPTILTLLQKLELDQEGIAYVGRIVRAAAIPSAASQATVVIDVPQPPAGSFVEALSKREYEILGHLAKRLSNKEIAEMLFISPVTVKRHLSNIYEKLGVHGRKEAVAKAVGLGLLKR